MSQRIPDYDAYRTNQARAEQERAKQETYGIDFFYDSNSPEYSGVKECDK